MQAQRLEGAGGRVDAVLRFRHHAAHDGGQASGALDRRLGTGGDDGARHTAGHPLLAQMEDDVGQLRLAGLIHQIGGAGAGLLHAHVERSVGAE